MYVLFGQLPLPAVFSARCNLDGDSEGGDCYEVMRRRNEPVNRKRLTE